ncbi:HtrA protease/chaperone protein [Minicystis rosea]|nr:HtrA protease/chaperone protein [Minicystis rosea]
MAPTGGGAGGTQSLQAGIAVVRASTASGRHERARPLERIRDAGMIEASVAEAPRAVNPRPSARGAGVLARDRDTPCTRCPEETRHGTCQPEAPMRSTLTLILVSTITIAGCRRASHDERPEPLQPAAAGDAAAQTVDLRRPARDAPHEELASFQDGFAAVAERVAPAVVNVSSVRIVQPPTNEGSPFFDDPMLREFFGGRGGPMQRPPRELKQQSLGSGVIISRDGYVLTNSHVVQGANEVRVSLPDKRELRAKIIGSDPKTDIALLQIQGNNFPVITWGDSTKVRVGQFALAFGDPLGIGPTVTLGIISAKGRGNVGIVDYEDFIQTDAAINPGNSGGPLVSTDGELIGINTAIATSGGGRGNQGIGFAVPSNLAREVVKQIQDHGHVIRGWLGVAVQEITPAMAEALGLKTTGGALISDVQDNSPAARAGLKRGDVVLELDGRAVGDSRGLRMAIAETPPGTVVGMTVLREGKRVDLKAALGQLPAEEKQAEGGPQAGPAGSLGMQIAPLTPDLARRLDMPEGATGVVITQVQPGSRAAEAGIRPGDIIQEIDRNAVQSPNDVKRVLEKDTKRAHLLLVRREGATRYVAIPAEESP